jgi:hypothetical protein
VGGIVLTIFECSPLVCLNFNTPLSVIGDSAPIRHMVLLVRVAS